MKFKDTDPLDKFMGQLFKALAKCRKDEAFPFTFQVNSFKITLEIKLKKLSQAKP